MTITRQPVGEAGLVRLPWDVLPRHAVRNDAGVWARADDGSWFILKSDYTAGTEFRPDRTAHGVRS